MGHRMMFLTTQWCHIKGKWEGKKTDTNPLVHTGAGVSAESAEMVRSKACRDVEPGLHWSAQHMCAHETLPCCGR